MDYKVLLVDDSRFARIQLTKLIADLRPGWKCVEAKNTVEALTMVQSDCPDFILIDFNLRTADGLQLANDFHLLCPNVPLALVSAYADKGIVEPARALGMDFIRKPVGREAMDQLLTRLKLRL